MAPAAGSRSAPPEDGVYRRSPALKQARFPSRRKMARGTGKPMAREEIRTLKQQTLTQINFVPGASDNPIVLSDSDADIASDGEDQPERRESLEEGKGKARSGNKEEISEDDEPRSSAARRTRLSIGRKKRRSASTDGVDRTAKKNKEETTKKKKKNVATPTRRVMQSAPGITPSSSYHTQTLTQFLGRDDRGFLDWLGMGSRSGAELPDADREGSVIPQTPPQAAAASPGLMYDFADEDCGVEVSDQHRPPKRATSPGEGPSRKRSLENARQTARHTKTSVIGDSFGMESLGSEMSMGRQSPGRGPSPNVQDGPLFTIKSTPEAVRHREDPLLDDLPKAKREVGIDDGNLIEVVRQKASRSGSSALPVEIPDSEEEGDDNFEDDHYGGGLTEFIEGNKQEEETFPTGAETQIVLEALAFNDIQLPAHNKPPANPTTSTSKARKVLFSSPATTRAQKPVQVQDLASPRTPSASAKTKAQRQVDNRRVLQRPVVRRAHDPSQFAESQRVAIHVLQALPPASARSDIILPVDPDPLGSILLGYEMELRMPFRIPAQVVRFWLFDGSHLRYMACVGPAQTCQSEWTYAVDQIYELNNPVADGDMREEGWVDGQIKRYVYLPPAIVGQLLWNLKHAIFGDGDGDGDVDNNQTPKGYASSLVKSRVSSHTPRRENSTPRPHVPHQARPLVQDRDPTPTQSTASNTQPAKEYPTQPDPKLSPPDSTRPHPNSLPDLPLPTAEPPLSLPEIQSPSSQQIPQSSISSSLVFQDHGDSNVVAPSGIDLSMSQLLTKSQMLPDTLIRDAPGFPRVIWDSEDDVEL